MPSLPLPLGSSLDGGDLPVSSTSDVLAIFPDYVRVADVAVVRDAIVSAITEIFLGYQSASSYSAQQSDMERATDIYEVGLAEDKAVIKANNETDEALRTRTFATPELVTPTAIMDAINAILANYTVNTAKYCESLLDAWYVNNGTSVWQSFVFTKTSAPADPNYPDRLYQSDAANNMGYYRPDSGVGDARVFTDPYGRFFLIRIPTLERIDDLLAAAYNTSYMGLDGFYVGSNATNTTFVYSGFDTAETIYQSIINTVERMRGHSIRWSLFVDPKLGN